MATDTLEFRNDDGHRYTALLSGEEVGHVTVDPIGSDGLLIKHTEILPAFEGRGFAGMLVRHVLEDAKRQGRGVIPVCTYAAAYIRKHPEFQSYVRK